MQVFPLDKVNEAYDRMLSGKARFRAVLYDGELRRTSGGRDRFSLGGVHDKHSTCVTSGIPFRFRWTLVDSVYQHVLAWREALERTGLELSVWRIHRRIGMSGGLLVDVLLRETGRELSRSEAERLQLLHAEAYKRLASQVRPLRGARDC